MFEKQQIGIAKGGDERKLMKADLNINKQRRGSHDPLPQPFHRPCRIHAH